MVAILANLEVSMRQTYWSKPGNSGERLSSVLAEEYLLGLAGELSLLFESLLLN